LQDAEDDAEKKAERDEATTAQALYAPVRISRAFSAGADRVADSVRRGACRRASRRRPSNSCRSRWTAIPSRVRAGSPVREEADDIDGFHVAAGAFYLFVRFWSASFASPRLVGARASSACLARMLFR
jgi:hypothetical protein